MSAWIALLALAAPQDPPRLYTSLPNGATVLVERMRAAETVSVSLWIAARTTPETAQTHGFRHLLEHLMAARPGLDVELETKGAFLRALTSRESMQFEVTAARSDLELAFDALRRVIAPLPLTAKQIADEVKVMAQELPLTEGPALFSGVGWSAAYGEAGLDPLGTVESMAKATPDALAQVQRQMLVGPNVVMVVAGNVDLDTTTQQARRLLEAIPRADLTDWAPRQAVTPSEPPIVLTSGVARAVPVGGFSEATTWHTLAAALAAASESPAGFATYTPSARPGLILFGQSEGDFLSAKVSDAVVGARLFPRGKALLRRWLSRTASPAQVSSFRGQLLALSPNATVERIVSIADRMTPADFAAAWARLDAESTIRLRGESR